MAVNRAAFDAFVIGRKIYSLANEAALLRSRRMFEMAVEIDPSYGRAWGYLGYTYVQWLLNGWSDDEARIAEAHARANECTRKAVELDPNDYHTHWTRASYYLYVEKEFDLALRAYETAVALNDRNRNLIAEWSEALCYAGRHDEALATIRRAMRLPDWFHWDLAWVCYFKRDYEGCLRAIGDIARAEEDPKYINDIRLLHAAALAQSGGDKTRIDGLLAAFLERRPDWDVEKELNSVVFKNPADRDHWLEGVRKAGLPERSGG